MPYSLLHRFQGCLSGMVMGEQLGRLEAVQPTRQNRTIAPFKWSRNPQTWHSWESQPLPDLKSSQSAIAGIEELIQLGDFSGSLKSGSFLSAIPEPERSAGTLLIATLPTTLFFHDDLTRQRQEIVAQMQGLNIDDHTAAWVVAGAYAIAQLLKGQVEPSQLISQITAYLRISSQDSAMVKDELLSQLHLLETLVDRHASLSEATGKLSSLEPDQEIAIAMYCFLATPDNIGLSLTRAIQMVGRSSIVGSITGMLSGAYNGILGLPVSWVQSLLVLNQGVEDARSIPLLASHLLAIWAGAYPGSAVLENEDLVVSAPWVLRSR